MDGVELVLFDMAGTTVDDMIQGKPAVAVAMQEAFSEFTGVPPSDAAVNGIRGLEKKAALAQLLEEQQGRPADTDAVEQLYRLFKERLAGCLPRINQEISGASACFAGLRDAGIKVCVGSGFPQATVDTIVERLGWSDVVDAWFSSETLGRGRPDPVMVHAAMEATGVVDPRKVLKVGDSVVDVEEGKAAGCWTVSVLTGTQGRQELARAHPDYMIDSVAQLLSEVIGLPL